VNRYFAIFKPFQVLSQFSSKEGKPALKDYFKFPKEVYPVGRLDYQSEGLLILTDDSALNQLLLHPSHLHEREYLVQVEGEIDQPALDKLKSGVLIRVDGKLYRTRPCLAMKMPEPPSLPERNPPIRFRKEIPTTWIRMVLTEGKNRQIRKMTAQTGFPTLRLLRYRIGNLTLEGIGPGQWKEMTREEIYRKLSID
jgi:23S rRNA pseudouridine2457 synthase